MKPTPLTIFLMLVASLILVATTPVSARKWTASDGREMEADYVSATADSVTIRKNGKNFTLKLDQFSAADQNWVRIKLATAKLPKPPFAIRPTRLESTHDGKDLKKLSARSLRSRSRKFASRDDWANAAKHAYWAVAAGADSSYNLSCYLALAGQKEDAFYWLQRSALTDGIDADWAQDDSDLESLQEDPRWDQVHQFLVAAGNQWRSSGLTTTNLVVPKGYDPKRPIPVVVWLHGFGADPEIDEYQDLATELGVAFLGVSGTIPHGPTSFAWANDLKRDQARIDAAFEQVKARLTPKPGEVVLFGFSQGAALSAELSAAHPERYAGAVILSPGSKKAASLPERASKGITQQTYAIACGAEENPYTVKRSMFYADGLKRLRAKVLQKIYPDQDRHTFPPDFDEVFPKWVTQILKLESESVAD